MMRSMFSVFVVLLLAIIADDDSAVNAFSTIITGTKSSAFWKTSRPTAHQRNEHRSSTSRTTSSTLLEMAHTLVLVRHGESTWNKENKFTGWVDCPLSEVGEEEATKGGVLLRQAGYKFDKAYTSTLKRAIKTLWIVLEQTDQMYIPIVNTWRLNERHYGALQGLDKKETVEKHGKEQVQIWRRSYDIPPPPVDESSPYFPGNDPIYANVPKDQLPRAESLKLTEERFMVEWEQVLVPEIKSGAKLIIAAHGNTLRALVKRLDNIPDDVIPGLNIPTGVPLIYELDEQTLQPIPHPDAITPLSGHYLGDQQEVQQRIGAVVAQTLGGQEEVQQRPVPIFAQTGAASQYLSSLNRRN